MNETEYDIELIDLYLRGKLDTQLREKFELRLKEDSDFKSFVEAQREVILGLKVDAFGEDVRAYLGSKKTTKTINFKPWILTGIAASIVVIVSVIYLFAPHEDLFHQYFEPYPDLISNRTTSDGSDAMFYYSSGKFAPAIASFDKKEVLNDHEKFYQGISYLAIDKTDQAKKVFSDLLITDRAPYAKWYLSLCYLKEHNHEKTIRSLQGIHKDEYNYTKATQIIEELTN